MREFAALLRDRRFVLLWLAMLASATGTFALLVAVSAHVLRNSGSGLAAAAVFASQWLLPVVLAPWVRRVCETRDLRRAVIACELASAVPSVGVAVFLRADSLAAVLLCFAVRGLFEAMTKTARVVFVRLMFDGPRLAAAAYTITKDKLAGMAVYLDAAALLTARAAWESDVGRGALTQPASIAKLYATEEAQRVVDDALQLFGAAGLVQGSTTEQLYRQIRSLRIYEGTSEIQKIIIATGMAKQVSRPRPAVTEQSASVQLAETT